MHSRQSRILLSITIGLIVSGATFSQTMAPDAAELTKLLNDFLAGASRNDPQIHDAFWADDLIYTRSAGVRVNKSEVMRNVRSAPPAKPDDPKTTYTAEDIRIQQYGTTAIVAFRLVATTERDGTTQISNLLNSGTFLKRNGKWQVVNWQSTRMPQSTEAAKTDVTRTHDAFFEAVLGADVKKLENLMHSTFVWTHRNGSRQSRHQVLDSLSSGQLKFSKLEPTNPMVSVAGDTAVVVGTATVQRSAVVGGNPDASPFTVSYTFVFANQGGTWVPMALHGSAVQ
ncbi:MAG TPA: nuclear transport factor 2 family protein [Pyrinomonadaceae bacterium]|nr:nuclear transport factor 2 family protein [Pyrinomonadaceae bacterium]